MLARKFLGIKIRALAARARRLAGIEGEAVGIRPQDRPYAPSEAHFRAANQRLATIDAQVARRLEHLQGHWQSAPLDRVLIDIALVEREVDRARRAFGLFFELFSQRGSVFAPTLAAHDVIAADCYAAIRQAAPRIFRGPLLKPLCYMEHGFSPATMRRGVQLNRLLGEPNPFPIVRLPWDRDNPWQAVFLHEVSHNLQADLGIWRENRQAVVRRVIRSVGDPGLTRIWGVWHKEIFADLAAILLGGPAAAWGMATFLAHPATRTMTFRPGGAHPTAYLRVHILAEMVRRLGFTREAERLTRVWDTLYRPSGAQHRLPQRLLASSSRLIPEVVDEIAFQTRRNLAHRSLSDIIPFRPEHEAAIHAGARRLAQGQVPENLPPRQLVSAASYALADGKIQPNRLSRMVIEHLNSIRASPAERPRRMAA
ncbi:hypothetical protein [Methylococcus sp. EFPC2]|uniref:hypothetical protein n=1 Tax=Methylococcus sp. EFPC2 TaxID=2812648 RepID=UPI001968936F|nr:hypothetical protein [Methylococcus sp. EFPC2]QSA97004.1 hypothetical protein JWZ97_17660 [Methylococcus sp. EFPC2]